MAGELRTGWPVVAACFATAVFAWGFAAYGPAVYMAELQRLHGWSAAAIGGATTVAFILAAGLLPWTSAAIGQFGGRAVLTVGILLIAVGAVGVSQATTPWQLYAWNLLIGCGWAGASSTAIATILSQYFNRRRGQALNLALTGGSVGGLVVAPGLVALSHRYGFQMAVPEVALGLILMTLPLVWVGIRSTGRYRRMATPDGGVASPASHTRRTALRDAQFWSVAAPFALAMFAMFGAMVYQVSYLLPLIGVSGTSLALICSNISGAGGRLLMSAVIDNLDQRLAAAATFATQAVALTLMIAMPHSPVALYLGCILFGLCVGNVNALPTLIIQREFAPSSFGVILGLSTAIGQVGYSLSPPLLGIVRDLTGDYRPVLGACVGLQLVATCLVLVGPIKLRLAKRQRKLPQWG